MFKIIIVLLSYLISCVAQAQNTIDTSAQAVEGRVKSSAQNIRNNAESVYFPIYDSPENCNNRITFDCVQKVVMDNSIEVVFENLPQKSFAIDCICDANNKGRMDFGVIGIALEDYGTSAQYRSYGQPSYRVTQFALTGKELTFDIRF